MAMALAYFSVSVSEEVLSLTLRHQHNHTMQGLGHRMDTSHLEVTVWGGFK